AAGALVALDPVRLQERAREGALIVDGRSEGEFDAAHIPGSVGVDAAHNGVGTKVAWMAIEGRDLLLVGADEAHQRRMHDLLGSVGVRASGMLAGGFAAWADDGRPLEAFEVVDVAELAELLERRPEVQVLDVRDDDEWETGRIPGSLHVPYHDVGRV